MHTFYTITDRTTTYCNSRSPRYRTLGEAQAAARGRLDTNALNQGVIVMQAVCLVEREAAPVKVTPLEGEAPAGPVPAAKPCAPRPPWVRTPNEEDGP